MAWRVACDDAQWRNKTTIQKKAIDNCLLVTIKDSIESIEGRMIHLSGRTAGKDFVAIHSYYASHQKLQSVFAPYIAIQYA